MTNKIRQHRPGYFTGWEDEIVEFNTKEELLAIPFVANFAKQDGFVRYSIDRAFDKPLLMAEYHDGTVWWVVGHLDEDIDLPQWEPLHLAPL